MTGKLELTFVGTHSLWSVQRLWPLLLEIIIIIIIIIIVIAVHLIVYRMNNKQLHKAECV